MSAMPEWRRIYTKPNNKSTIGYENGGTTYRAKPDEISENEEMLVDLLNLKISQWPETSPGTGQINIRWRTP